MKIVIFCGGAGTRFWPLSRKALPKQFDTTIFNHKSTFQMAIERILPSTKPDDIYVATNDSLSHFITDQFKDIKPSNLILEPAFRDLAPAVGLVANILNIRDPDDPFSIIWSDHIVEKPQVFREMLKKAEKLIRSKKAGIIFYGHKPRFANENLGWISHSETVEKEENVTTHKFISWKYRPNREDAQDLFDSKKASWNLGYWTTTPKFLVEKYKVLAPEMQKGLERIVKYYKTANYNKELKKIYPHLEKISFDDKIVNFIKPYEALVLVSDIGWSDPGTLYALKESLQKSFKDNVMIGSGIDLDSTDCLVFNRNRKLLTATLGLTGHIVIVTDDVVFVCPKEKVPEIKALIKKLEEWGLTKYL